ncbi:hypothetical protein CIL05_14995 [Virgibacillus profundi]|uniref:Winged helix-turn-helix domain-containing protein n=1 Tax=Virgibacillus profundi TaxID=2024555 RepID=A0A2A2IAJ4_9BACI|nr:crosslink repair DNA glycosylase YcaQ family protein [Virgibacillus profundi]PAV28602.1 hypothetical protein CIL05_14995 [Virgibacillus profundi]PXY52770.1 winged helix-turn-helix domain-containing protein [Virgibacillus profundi]
MNSYQTNKQAARRFLLDTQQLLFQDKNQENCSTKEKALELIRKLECVQLDAVASVERNQHLVLAARMDGYRPEMLNELLAEKELFEYWANAACAIPMEDYPLFESTRIRFQNKVQEKIDKLGPIADEVLERLQAEGPLASRAFRTEDRVHGAWDNKLPKTKATSHALNLLLDTAAIRVVRRTSSERYFDLTDQTIPGELLERAEQMDVAASSEVLMEKYLRAYRVFDLGDARLGWQKMSAKERREAIGKRVDAGSVIPLEIEGIRRQYYILAEDLNQLKVQELQLQEEQFSMEETQIRFLPPLDNLLWRRERLVDLFDFYYKWEVYTPKEKRRYGYYAMPILTGDRLIGRIDPGLDRENQQLNIRLLQIEPWVEVTPRLLRNLREALESFAAFHQANDIAVERAVQELRIF